MAALKEEAAPQQEMVTSAKSSSPLTPPRLSMMLPWNPFHRMQKVSCLTTAAGPQSKLMILEALEAAQLTNWSGPGLPPMTPANGSGTGMAGSSRWESWSEAALASIV